MDALAARYASAHDEFSDENDQHTQLLTKPSHAHQFTLPPIAQAQPPIPQAPPRKS